MTNASSMHDAGHPKPVLWDNLEGWGREGGGRGHDGGGHMHVYSQFKLMYGKNHYNIVK